jgi:hypothetical protein
MKKKISEHFARPLIGYTEAEHAEKVAAHHAARATLKKLARDYLMLPVGEYGIRSNMGGPAVSGEITLHCQTLYLQIAQSCMGASGGVMYRACNGMKDYSGGQNRFCEIAALDDLPAFTMKLRAAAIFGFVLPDEPLRPGDHNGLTLHRCA